MATSFSRKKHQNEKASEASDFFCTRFQMCTKHLEKVSTIRNHFMFLQMVDKKDNYSLSETEANWTRISLLFRTNFQLKSFLAFLTFNQVCMIKLLLWIREKCVLSWNTDNYKVWNKFWVVGNLLRWTPLVVFQKYSSPFLIKYCSKGIYSLLYGGLRRYEARKITKIEEFWWNKSRTSEKWQPHSDEKSTKKKELLRPQIFYAPVSKCVPSIWKQYWPLETILCFSRWSKKRTPTASQKQKQFGLEIP